jgi:hypothetical protein
MSDDNQQKLDLDTENPTSDPAIDAEHATGLALAVIVREMADSNHRIVRRKIKSGGIWYHVEVARP